VLARNRLLLAAREAETGKAEAEQGKRGGFRHCNYRPVAVGQCLLSPGPGHFCWFGYERGFFSAACSR
jgi:hypothetical protein